MVVPERFFFRAIVACALALASAVPVASAQTASAAPGELEFRALYEELVEIDSSPTTGSCTRVVRAAQARLAAAGFTDSDAQLIIPDGAPEDGNLVARIEGANRRAGAILLLAHIDVVDARREDWTRDPFTLIEEDGYFYGRGVADDKAMAAIFLDMFIRMRTANYRPRRTLKLALTCGEETSNRVNGVDYLIRNHRDLIEADFAINEGGDGVLSEDGRPLALLIQVGEKIHQVFELEVTNPGGHSSRPVPENAIYRLSAGLQRLSHHQFPVSLSETTRRFFEHMAPIIGGDAGAAMTQLAADPGAQAAAAYLARNPNFNAMMRSTCVATQLDAGHAPNALPQRARATLSCRILQSETAEAVQAELERALNDPQIAVRIVRRRNPSPPPPLAPRVLDPAQAVAAQFWPGVPLVPYMVPGATDGRFLNAASIHTYGLSGIFSVPGESNAHGLNERLRVDSVMRARAYLDALIRAYADAR
ncbi:MAG: M20/M25/M40 family metallo-hydrolase [Alphaproteobacteria bacterium]|nr:M20/M25/M40 family metallo-hydrolase [Alphaproteobacteria bacterium]